MNMSELKAMGVIATVGDDGGLKLEARKGVLTGPLVEKIKEAKPALLAEIGRFPAHGGDSVNLVNMVNVVSLCKPEKEEGAPQGFDIHAAPISPARHWLLHYPDRGPVEVFRAPPAVTVHTPAVTAGN